MKIIRFFIGAIFLLIVTGCTSAPRFVGSADFTGCICSSEGKAVKGYTVILDGRQTVTGEGGIFVFPDVDSGKKTLSGGKNGWCSFETEFQFNDKKSICYIQVKKIDDLFDQVEDLLRRNDFDEAERLLFSERKFNGNSRIFNFYCNVVALKKGDKSVEERIKEFL